MEMMIAIVACAIILAAVHTVFYGAVRLRNTTDAAIAEKRPRWQALSVIEHDLANLMPVGGILTSNLQYSGGAMSEQVSPEFYVSTGTLSDETPWPEVQKVSYLLTESTNAWAGKDLIRAVMRNVLAESDEQPTYQWLLGGVNQVAFQFFDGSQWQDSWDSTTEAVPTPVGIRVQIELTSTNRQDQLPLLEVVVPISVQSRTNATEQTETTTSP